MKQLLLAILLLLTFSVHALTVEDEISMLEAARDYQIDVISTIGYSTDDHIILKRIEGRRTTEGS